MFDGTGYYSKGMQKQKACVCSDYFHIAAEVEEGREGGREGEGKKEGRKEEKE